MLSNESEPALLSTEEVELRAGSDLAYLLADLKPSHLVSFLVVGDRVVAGVRVDCTTGATGADVIGENVVVDTLAVEPDERRKGYGRATMQAVEAWLRRQPGLPPVLSLGVPSDNDAAIALYESLGYVTLRDADDQPVLLPPDCFVMYKHLE